jgi:hypothetical protein
MTNHIAWILILENRNIFFEKGWTSSNSRLNGSEVICPSGCSVAGGMRFHPCGVKRHYPQRRVKMQASACFSLRAIATRGRYFSDRKSSATVRAKKCCRQRIGTFICELLFYAFRHP